jgi:hypothetical protein
MKEGRINRDLTSGSSRWKVSQRLVVVASLTFDGVLDHKSIEIALGCSPNGKHTYFFLYGEYLAKCAD